MGVGQYPKASWLAVLQEHHGEEPRRTPSHIFWDLACRDYLQSLETLQKSMFVRRGGTNSADLGRSCGWPMPLADAPRQHLTVHMISCTHVTHVYMYPAKESPAGSTPISVLSLAVQYRAHTTVVLPISKGRFLGNVLLVFQTKSLLTILINFFQLRAIIHSNSETEGGSENTEWENSY